MVAASTHRGLGVTAGLDAGIARELAAHAEQLGYHSLWSNDEPTAPGLDTLAEFASVATKVQLGVGVLPLHRYLPAQTAAEVDRLGIDPARLWLGIGSGALPLQVDALQRAVAELRALLPEKLASWWRRCDPGCAASAATFGRGAPELDVAGPRGEGARMGARGSRGTREHRPRRRVLRAGRRGPRGRSAG